MWRGVNPCPTSRNTSSSRSVSAETGSGARIVAQPILKGSTLWGAAALVLEPNSATDDAEALRRLHWGLGWLGSMLC